MRVYVVLIHRQVALWDARGSEEQFVLAGVFSNRDDAESYAHDCQCSGDATVQECVLDEPAFEVLFDHVNV